MGFHPVRSIGSTGFRLATIGSALLVALLLVTAIGALFLVPETEDILDNLWSAEMRFSLKLSLLTGVLSTALVMLFALPIGYALSRFQFPLKGLVKTVLDLPIAFPELVLGLCLLLLFGNSVLGDLFRSWGLQFVFTQQGIVVAQFFTALPYAGRIIRNEHVKIV